MVWASRRAAVGAVLAGALMMALLPGAVAAATRPTTFWLYMGQSCVGGKSSDRATVNVLWKGAKGRVKAKATVQASRNGGNWEVCSPTTKLLRRGDVVKTTVNGVTHRLVIPRLSLRMNTKQDRFYGRAPAKSTIKLGWDSSGIGELNVKVGPRGRWSHKQPGYDIVKGLHAYARWQSPKGDTVTFENVAP